MSPAAAPRFGASRAVMAASVPFAVSASVPADQATVRRANMALVLQTVRTPGPWSRARIASETGLTKATVSSLVGALIERHLIRDGEIERGNTGRPGQLVGLDVTAAFFIGLEINVDYVAGVVTDLEGVPIARQRVSLDVRGLGPTGTLARAAQLATELLGRVGSGVAEAVTLNLAIPGMIDIQHGVLAYAPNLDWRDVEIAPALHGLLNMPRTRIGVDNEANMAAVAEYTAGSAAGVRDLLVLTGEVGIGGGVMAGGELLRGNSGFFGEVGHMAIGDRDSLCGCGRRGCWETVVGLAALLRVIADPDDDLHDPALDLVGRLAEIGSRADAGNARTLSGLASVATSLGVGASILVNIFNPEVIIFGGYFAALSRFLDQPIRDEMNARVIAPNGGGCRIEYSTLGFDAAVLGGAHAGIQWVMSDPSVVDVASTDRIPGPRSRVAARA